VVATLRDSGLSEFAVPGGVLVAVVVIAAGLGVVASIRPSRRAARLDVLQAIATERGEAGTPTLAPVGSGTSRPPPRDVRVIPRRRPPSAGRRAGDSPAR